MVLDESTLNFGQYLESVQFFLTDLAWILAKVLDKYSHGFTYYEEKSPHTLDLLTGYLSRISMDKSLSY